MEFFDIGAVVYILHKCIWWVPDFRVDRYHRNLERLDAQIRRDGVFAAHSTRYLIEAQRRIVPEIERAVAGGDVRSG
jgi:hypothetical protein